MSLNDISLSPEMLQAMYTRSLLLPDEPASPRTSETTSPGASVQPTKPMHPAAQTPETQPAKEAQPVAPLSWLGKNARNFVIVVNYTDQLHLPDEALNFLVSVLKACQLTIADVAILNTARQNASLAEISAQLQPSILLAFGTNTTLPELSPGAILVPQRSNQLQYMIAPPLEQLNQSTEAVKPLKKQLWESLKQMLQL